MQAPDPTPYPLDHLASRGAPRDPAVKLRDRVIDYRTLESLVGGYAAALADRLRRGERVASWLPKEEATVVLPLAAARAGLVHVPINPVLKRAQVAHILADSGAQLLVTAPERAATLADGDLPEGCGIVSPDELGQAADQAEPLPPSSREPGELAALLYTSGSTGRPKGVMLSHANLWLGAVSVAHYLGLRADDVTLAALPLSFDYGQNQLLSAWAAGAAAVPIDYLLPRDLLRAMERHGVTTLAGVPPLWVQLLEVDWPSGATASLRRMTNTGGRMAVPMVRALRARAPEARLFSMYGLTEAFRATFLDPGLVDAHPESIGRAVPFAEVLVVRSDGGEALPGEAGELVQCGPLVAQGYWQDPERTAVRFRPAPPYSRYGGRAVWSGDTVVADAAGLLRFVGRVDDMIKVAGNRVSPTEIEEVAVASGLVAEAVALGVPDERLGAAIRLVVRARPGGADEDGLRRHLKAELPGYMQPQRILWRDELPHNPNGKLDRAAIAAEAQS